MRAGLKKAGLPYLLLLPGLGWLALFFALPLGYMLFESLKSGTPDTGFLFNWEFSNYTDAISTSSTSSSSARSSTPALATLICVHHRLPARLRDRVPRRALAQRACCWR